MAFNEGKHVMLSYNHKSKDVVKAVYDALGAANVPVWYDSIDMDANMYDGMAAAVHDATVVCCFMSPEYENSENCKMELEHAKRLNKRIIPCMMTNRKIWKPSPAKWLSLITGSEIAIDFSDNSNENVSSKAKELIDRLKKDSLTVKTRSNKPFESIRQVYSEQNRMKRVVNEAKTFSLERSYINLAMVETKEQQEKEKKLKGEDDDNATSKPQKETILGTYEEIYGVKTSVEVNKIFEKCKDSTKKALVLGRAGIGKSTFCQYVTYQWAKKKLWLEYELVVLIHLRKLTDGRYPSTGNYSPMDIVEKEYFPFPGLSDDERGCFKEYYTTGKLLWILDGYDEFVQNIPNQLKDVFDHILQTQHHILTSRPYAIALPYDVKMEILGFTDKNIVQYVEHFFEELTEEIHGASSQGKNLLNFLKSNVSIWGVAHIPVNLELICSLWSDTDWSKKRTLTMTVLYENITEWLCRRYLQKRNIDPTQMRKKTVYDQCHEELHFLETLAFNAMEYNDIILPPTLLEETEEETGCNLDRHPQLLNFGVLKSYDDKATGRQNQAEKQYYFTHLSFQEYFAARHLLQLLKSAAKEKAKNFIGMHKYNRRFLYVFIFASGLLAESEYKACMQTFWAEIEEEPVDLVGLAHIKLIIECLDELEGRALFPQSADYVKSICNWLNITISEKPDIIFQHLLLSLQRTQSICNNTMIQQKLLALLKTSDERMKKKTLYLLKNITISTPLPALISELLHTIQDKDADLRKHTGEALAKLGEKAATKDVIDALITVFSHQDENIRQIACETLGKLGEKAAAKDVIDSLIVALRDPSERVRWRAYQALGNLSEKTVTKTVLDALIIALGGRPSNITRVQCETLGDLGEKVATKDVIDALTIAVTHGNVDVRPAACETLGKLGKKAATKDVIDTLIVALGEDDPYVRENACLALVKLDEKTASSEVVNALIIGLRHPESSVRKGSSEALSKLNHQAATDALIDAQIVALHDQDPDIRQEACVSLGHLGERAATKAVIDALIIALGDEDEYLQNSAYETLGELGEKAATKEVIDALIAALDYQPVSVRRDACKTLGKLGEKAATKEVIDALVAVLGDVEVESEACAALANLGKNVATKDVIDTLLITLADQSRYRKSGACEALGCLGEKAATKDVIDALIITLTDQDGYVKSSACKALGKLGNKAATQPVINLLVIALADHDEKVRGVVCETLGQLGEAAVTSDVINALIVALSDPDVHVRGKASKALGKLGSKAGTKALIGALVIALGDQDTNVKIGACEALGYLGEKAASKNVIDALIIAFGDQNTNVRPIVCKTLGKLGGKAATKGVIDALIIAVGDQNKYVKCVACDALGKLGEKAATKAVIDALMIALGDEDEHIYQRAYEALSELGEKAKTEDAIDSLTVALRHRYRNVKIRVCGILSKLGEKAATKAVIDALIAAFGDQDGELRWKTWDTLGNLGEKAARDDVIDALMVALNDRDFMVRQSACQTLGKLGEKAATKVVIDALIVALGDQNDSVEWYACEALGKLSAKATGGCVVIAVVTAYIGHGIEKADKLVARVLAESVSHREVMKGFDANVLCKLDEVIRDNVWSDLTRIPGDDLIKLFLETKIEAWLPLATYGSLLQGAAVTFLEKENKLLVFHANEVFEVSLWQTELREALMESFKRQKALLGKNYLAMAKKKQEEEESRCTDSLE